MCVGKPYRANTALPYLTDFAAGECRVGCQRFKYIARSVHVRLFGLAYAKWRTPLLFLLVLVSFGVLEYGWRHIPKPGLHLVQPAKGYLTDFGKAEVE